MVEDVENPIQQMKIIRETHENHGHRGTLENFKQIQRKYYFPNLKSLIQKYINRCEVCLTNKYDRQKHDTKFEITESPTKPLEIIHLDTFFIQNHKFLTILDKFSKYGTALQLEDSKGIEISQLLTTYISIHGIPKKIVTDVGTEFNNNICKDLCKTHNIELHFTTPKSSTGNSPVERFHSTIIEIYRILLSQSPNKNASKLMTETIIIYNNTIHSTTNFTPMELKNGHYQIREIFPENVNIPLHEYIQQQNENYKNLCNKIYTKNHTAKIKIIERLNKNRKDPISFQQNDIIFERTNRRDKVQRPS